MNNRLIILRVHTSDSRDNDLLRFRAESGASVADVDAFVRQSLSLHPDDAIEWFEAESGIFMKPNNLSKLIGSERLLSIFVRRHERAPGRGAPLLLIEGRAFDICNGLEICSRSIRIYDYSGSRKEGTGLNTWDGSVVLAKYLERNADTVRGKRILELGAGTGLAGIAAHAIGAKFTVLTDLEYALANLKENVVRNIASESSEAEHIFVRPLDWFDKETYLKPSDVTLMNPSDENLDYWDVVIGSDVVWLEELVPGLVGALEAHVSTNTVSFLAHQVRLSL